MDTIVRGVAKDNIIYIDGLKCRCNKINITIYESYNINNDDIEAFVVKLRKETEKLYLKYERDNLSWVREIYAHNLLYRRNMFVSSTKDTDLTDGEEWYRLLFYRIIFVIGKIKETIVDWMNS